MSILQPKRTKYRKRFKGTNKGCSSSALSVNFGTYGLKATSNGFLTARQIEAARRAMTRCVNRGGKIWIRVFPDKPITTKPLEVRQGGGKGNVERWVFVVRRGYILFEIGGLDAALVAKAFRLAAAKLPVSTTMVDADIL